MRAVTAKDRVCTPVGVRVILVTALRALCSGAVQCGAMRCCAVLCCEGPCVQLFIALPGARRWFLVL